MFRNHSKITNLLKPRQTPYLLPGAVAILIVGFAGWRCWYDPQINFLPADARAEWIAFPTPFDPSAHNLASIDTIFRRDFVLQKPSSGKLYVRGAKQLELRINDKPVSLHLGRNWKVISSEDAGSFLRSGQNTIEVRVFNDDGPPAVWLVLQIGDVKIRSDDNWEASCAGSSWRKAVRASRPRLPGAGNPVGRSEQTWRAFTKVWPIWICFDGIALATLGGSFWLIGRERAKAFVLSTRGGGVVIVILGVLWLALFCNNARLIPFSVGFDAEAHADYIKYVQERHSLPLPNEGYEMFQSPLYYTYSALVLSSCGLSVNDHSGILLLRFLTTLLGIANFTVVFLSLRLMFPGQPGKQLIGLLLAAFLPMQLYLSHFLTNETLAATLMTTALFLILRLLHKDRPSVLQFGLTGFVAGLAILTKTTAILLLPPLLLLALLKRGAASQSFAAPLRNIATMLAVCFVVSSWYYIWIWHHFGRPVVGNWEYDVGFHWWQDPGYHSVLDYLRFGYALDRPFFSSLYGFADGIYSTLWGDALLSGTSSLDLRVPWNYDLMTAGYLLAVVPSVLIFIGLGAALRNTRSAMSASWMVLLSFCVAVALGFLFITLRVPSYAQVKAFYGMALLIPLCCFAAMGWDAVTRRHKTVRLVLYAILLIFAFNSYTSAWIRPSAAQHVYAGIRLFLEQNPDAAMAQAQQVIDLPNKTANTRRVLALLLSELKHPAEALEQAKWAVELEPSDGASQLQLAMVLAGRGDFEEAIQLARAAVQLGPENWMACQELATWSLQTRLVDEAFSAAKDGLAVAPFNPELHYTLALAAATKRDFATAANHFGYAVMIRKDWAQATTGLRQSIFALVEAPDASRQLDQIVGEVPDSAPELDGLAWILATHPDAALRNGNEAIRLARRGCEITNFRDPTLLATLAAAYAEVGLFSQATSTVERALNLSRTSANLEVAGLSKQLLESFRQNHPYRNAPIPP